MVRFNLHFSLWHGGFHCRNHGILRGGIHGKRMDDPSPVSQTGITHRSLYVLHGPRQDKEGFFVMLAIFRKPKTAKYTLAGAQFLQRISLAILGHEPQGSISLRDQFGHQRLKHSVQMDVANTIRVPCFSNNTLWATTSRSNWTMVANTPIPLWAGFILIIFILIVFLYFQRRINQQSKTIFTLTTTARKDNPHFEIPNPDRLESEAESISISGHSRAEQMGFILPRVIISNKLLPKIHQYITAYLRENGQELEAGGVLIGEYYAVNGAPLLKVNGFIESGPKANCNPGSIEFDCEYANQILQAVRLQYPSTVNVGCIHRHPGAMDFCSGGDKVADRQAVQEAPSKCLLFGIITLNSNSTDPHAIYHRDFKINFYLMSESVGYEYIPVYPTFEDIPLVECNPALVAIIESRSGSVSYDFFVMRHIKDVQRAVVNTVETDNSQAIACIVTLKDGMGCIHAICYPMGNIRVVWKTPDGNCLQVPGVWDDPKMGLRMRADSMAWEGESQPSAH